MFLGVVTLVDMKGDPTDSSDTLLTTNRLGSTVA